MARLTSAAELKEALNRLCPAEAWGDRADVERMYHDGLTSLKYLSTTHPDMLQSYGVPAFQAGYLQQLAKDATAGKLPYTQIMVAVWNKIVCTFLLFTLGVDSG